MKQDGDLFVLTDQDHAIPDALRQVHQARLRVWKVDGQRFASLASCTNLVELQIMDYLLDSLDLLAGLTRLRRLRIVHLPHVHALDPLAGLTQLEELTLETTPSWDASGRNQVVATLRPLAGLHNLRVLALAGVVAADGDLAPLHGLDRLRHLRMGNHYPQAERARLVTRLPHLQGPFLGPYEEIEHYVCRRCGCQKVMLTGSDIRNPKVICPTCQHIKFAAVTGHFAELVDAAR